MAQKKNGGEGPPGAGDQAGEGLTRKEAVRRSLEKLGNEASTRDIQADVKARFGFDMSLDHVRVVRRNLRAEAGASEAGGAAGEKITKKEAVRRSLAELGKKAPLADIQAHVKERFGLEMTVGHISTTRGQLRREARRGKGARRKPPAEGPAPSAPRAEAAAVPPGQAPAAGPNGAAVLVDDIRALKGLVERVGADQLKALIDLFRP